MAGTKRKRSKKAGQDLHIEGVGLNEKLHTPGYPEWPLRCIFVGHNPSQQAWQKGHFYANPSNRMWYLLYHGGITPKLCTPSEDGDFPIDYGLGFSDLGNGVPGTDSLDFDRNTLRSWRQGLYRRLAEHAQRAAETIRRYNAASEKSTSDADGSTMEGSEESHLQDGYPAIVAFTGKRQWRELFFGSKEIEAQVKTVTCGVQTIRPPFWPFPASATKVVVLASSSGASALTHEARLAPYKILGEELAKLEWLHNREQKLPPSLAAITAADATGHTSAGAIGGTAKDIHVEDKKEEEVEENIFDQFRYVEG